MAHPPPTQSPPVLHYFERAERNGGSPVGLELGDAEGPTGGHVGLVLDEAQSEQRAHRRVFHLYTQSPLLVHQFLCRAMGEHRAWAPRVSVMALRGALAECERHEKGIPSSGAVAARARGALDLMRRIVKAPRPESPRNGTVRSEVRLGLSQQSMIRMSLRKRKTVRAVRRAVRRAMLPKVGDRIVVQTTPNKGAMEVARVTQSVLNHRTGFMELHAMCAGRSVRVERRRVRYASDALYHAQVTTCATEASCASGALPRQRLVAALATLTGTAPARFLGALPLTAGARPRAPPPQKKSLGQAPTLKTPTPLPCGTRPSAAGMDLDWDWDGSELYSNEMFGVASSARDHGSWTQWVSSSIEAWTRRCETPDGTKRRIWARTR